MHGMDNYDNHLMMLENFDSLLSALENKLTAISAQYKRQIDAMESAGFMQDYTQTLEGKYYTFSSKIDQMNALIGEHHSKLENHKTVIESLKAMARSGS